MTPHRQSDSAFADIIAARTGAMFETVPQTVAREKAQRHQRMMLARYSSFVTMTAARSGGCWVETDARYTGLGSAAVDIARDLGFKNQNGSNSSSSADFSFTTLDESESLAAALRAQGFNVTFETID